MSKRLSQNAGFTLVEMMVSSALTLIVFSQIFIALVSSQRLVAQTIANTDIALRSRELRDKLLFRLDANGGLLSAPYTGLHGDTVRLTYKINNTQNSIFYDGTQLKATDTLTPVTAEAPQPRWLTFPSISFKNNNDTWCLANNVAARRTMTFRFHLATGQVNNQTTHDLIFQIPLFGRTVLNPYAERLDAAP